MTEHPILFSTPMVQAILAGNKTQTRRILKGDALEYLDQGFSIPYIETPEYKFCPYGKPGDILWVRETWAASNLLTSGGSDFSHYVFKADEDPLHNYFKWKPSIHMPKAAARIWLQIEAITVQRLLDIGDVDARAEGIKYDEQAGYDCYLCNTIKHNIANLCEDGFYRFPVDSFLSLWESINGQLGGNPWVWAIKFKVLSTTGKPQTLPTATRLLPTTL